MANVTVKKPWSDNPYAPQILYGVYRWEKANFVGMFASAILYGIIVVLFYQCMNALLSPVNRRSGGIVWGLVAHTVAMFSFVTIDVCMKLDIQSISFIDNREYPGNKPGVSGPYVYQLDPLLTSPIKTVPEIMAYLNMWLAGGLLLYRCYIIYSKNYWIIAFPFLLYFASIVTSIMTIINNTHPDILTHSIYSFMCYPISLSLTILLTFMIVMRLVLHGRAMQNAMGSGTSGTAGLWKTVLTTFIESYALHAISFIIDEALGFADNPIVLVSDPIFSETQVIAPLLIILRVAQRRALTSESISSGGVVSMRFRGQGESSFGGETTHDGDTASSTEVNEENSGKNDSGTESVIEEVPR